MHFYSIQVRSSFLIQVSCMVYTNDWRSNRLHRNTSNRHLRIHLRAHVDLFLELNLLRSTIVHNNAIQRAAPSSPSKNAILWIKCDKRQMTSCVHKMCGRTYGQTNMKRATTLAKINHPCNRYKARYTRYKFCIQVSIQENLDQENCPFHVWLTICPFAHLVYATSNWSFVAFYSYMVSWLSMIWACTYYTDFTNGSCLREL
jgi:hypothetical protein